MKRVIVYSVSIILLVAIAIAIFFVFSKANRDAAPGTPLAQKIENFFPFGHRETTTPTETPQNEGEEIPVSPEGAVAVGEMPRVRKLFEEPVAGATSLVKKREIQTETSSDPVETTTSVSITGATTTPAAPLFEDITYVRFVEKASGHIYDIALDEETSTRITNTTIPRVAEAFFGLGGTKVLMRYLTESETSIDTWEGTIGESPAPNGLFSLTGAYLDPNILSVAVSPDETSFLSLRTIGDTTYGYTNNFSTGEKKEVLDSSFGEWIPAWERPLAVTLTAKATGYLLGYAYHVPLSSGAFNKFIGSLTGLTTLPDHQGRFDLYGTGTTRRMDLYLLDETTGETSSLPVDTLPEKCVWSRTSAVAYCAVPTVADGHLYPDEWYRGEYTSRDSLWKIDAVNGIALFVTDISEEGGVSLDATNLMLTKDETFLTFINKSDQTLWGVAL